MKYNEEVFELFLCRNRLGSNKFLSFSFLRRLENKKEYFNMLLIKLFEELIYVVEFKNKEI